MKEVALVLNSRYVEQSIVFLNSLFFNNKDEKFEVYVVNSELQQEEIRKIQNICAKYGNNAIDVKVDDTLFENAPILWETHAKEAYYKLLLPEIIPVEVKKIVYFDIDIIIKGKIEDLYNIDIEDYYLAAVPDYFVNKYDKEYVNNLGIDDGKYFNSGVVVFNLEKIRKVYKFSVAEKYIKENGKNFHYHDQEVLNALFKEKVLLLNSKYNHIAKYKGIKDFLYYIFGQYKDTRVIHYAGIKPWNYLDYYGKFYNEFWKYVEDDMGFEKEKQQYIRKKNCIIIFLKTIKHLYDF